ncbi:MAG: four helix bundle protein [Chitinophagales bacterium]
MPKSNNPVLKLTFEFSVQIVLYCELLEEKKKYVISKQLLKSGTSIGANIREAQNAESKLDFIHKIKIALKELEETEYWLEICKHVESYPDCDSLLIKLLEIRKIITKILAISKINLKK